MSKLKDEFCMNVVESKEDRIVFDNGLTLSSTHDQDCCERNYIDFEQFPVGTQLPKATAAQFLEMITIRDDGFSVKDSKNTPLWAQARSIQNGYYTRGVSLVIDDGSVVLKPHKHGQDYGELFSGREQGR